jgi:hypothetical protein
VSKNTADTHLGNAHYQILVIRFLVDGQGQLQQGVVVDLNEQPVGRFRELEAIPGLVACWLRTQEQRASDQNGPMG